MVEVLNTLDARGNITRCDPVRHYWVLVLRQKNYVLGDKQLADETYLEVHRGDVIQQTIAIRLDSAIIPSRASFLHPVVQITWERPKADN